MSRRAKINLASRALIGLGYPNEFEVLPFANDVGLQGAEHRIPHKEGFECFGERTAMHIVALGERRIFEWLDHRSDFDDFPYSDVKKALEQAHNHRKEFDFLGPNLP